MSESSRSVRISPDDYSMTAVRSQGAGGQNVNKVATAIQLRFEIAASSLPERVKHQLFGSGDRRITRDGVIVIKAQRFRTQDKNRVDAVARLQAMIDAAARPVRKRIATKPSKSAVKRRRQSKQRHSQLKASRRSGADD